MVDYLNVWMTNIKVTLFGIVSDVRIRLMGEQQREISAWFQEHGLACWWNVMKWAGWSSSYEANHTQPSLQGVHNSARERDVWHR